MSSNKLSKTFFLSVFAASAFSVNAQAADAIKTLDLMVLYTPDMVNSRYGSDLDARFAYLEDYTNQTLKNSRVNSQIRIVHTEPTPAEYSLLTSTLLSKARTDSTIAALRKKHGADFVMIMGKATAFCGLGYVPGGDPKTGQLRSYSPNYAYSLVSYNCGGATFAHELGHNMSLGHSVRQNSKGGVWPWAIGHGGVGRWVSTMGYTSSYSTRNRLQYYSNPRINECEGDACGINDRADSSKNLNLLASQHVDFMPEVYSTGSGTGTGGSMCIKTNLENNLLQEGDFNLLSPWKSFFKRSSLNILAQTMPCGIDNRLNITDRTAYYSGVSQDITSVVKTGVDYQFSIKAKLGSNSRQNLRVYLAIRANNRMSYQRLGNISITGNEYTKLETNFVLKSINNTQKVDLILFGPEANIDILLDEALLTSSNNSGGTTTTNYLLNSDFNNGLQGWKGSFKASVTHDGVNGNGSMSVSKRTKWYQGARKDVKGLLASNTTYQLEADIFVDGNGSANLRPYLYRRMADAKKGWIPLGNRRVVSGSWQKVKFNVSVSEVDNASILDLYFMGPGPGVNFKMDNIRITKIKI